MFLQRQLCAVALFGAFAIPAHAGDIALATTAGQAGYGEWNVFNVSDIDSQSFGTEWIDNNDSASPLFGTPLSFSFTIAAGTKGALTVVDGAFAGDTFTVTNFGSSIGKTSTVAAQTYDTAPNAGYDFDAALADPSFSHARFVLGAGTYRISGMLDQSVTLDGVSPLNSTVGALSLTVSAVPEPATWAAMLAGLTLLGAAMRRRRQ